MLSQREKEVADEIGQILASYLDDCREAVDARIKKFQEEVIVNADNQGHGND